MKELQPRIPGGQHIRKSIGIIIRDRNSAIVGRRQIEPRWFRNRLKYKSGLVPKECAREPTHGFARHIRRTTTRREYIGPTVEIVIERSDSTAGGLGKKHIPEFAAVAIKGAWQGPFVHMYCDTIGRRSCPTGT